MVSILDVAALHTTTRTPTPKPPVDEFDVENEYDPACRSLREQSQSLKWSFKEQSIEYDMLKYEFRRVIGGVTMRIDSVSAHLAQYRSYDAILSDFVPTLPRVSGGSEILVQATDSEGLSVVQSVSALSDATRKVSDLAMSRLKACCDDLDEVEHEIAEFLEYLETVSIGLKTALAAQEVDVLHILRYLASEIRLSRANILTEVRSYW
ncbi:hypothetical protein KCU64_g14715, partial [Aureobasidium melanogenum]